MVTAINRLNAPAGNYGTAVARAKDKPMPASPAAVVADPEREARISDLRERYRSGTYHVDSQSVAARIVDEHL